MQRAKHGILFPIVLLMIGMTIFSATGWSADFRVHNGIIDLRAWGTQSEKAPLSLDGEWYFYPNRLVESDDSSQAILRKVPGIWQGGTVKFGTYKARIEGLKGGPYGLRTPGYTSSSRIYVNGKLMFEGGTVSDRADSETRSRQSKIIALEQAESYDITIQVTSFQNSRGGLYLAPRFGLYEDLELENKRQILTEAMVVAGFFAIGLYHLMVFVMRRNYVVLVFALSCIATAVRTAYSNQRVVSFFLDLDYDTALRIEYLSLYLMNPLMEIYLAFMFRQEYPWRLFKFRILCFVAVIATVLLPIRYFTSLLPYCHISHALGFIVCTYTVINARFYGRLGSNFMVIGSVTFVAFGSWDLYNSLNHGTSIMFLVHIGFFAYIINQAGAIAQDHNQTFLKLIESQNRVVAEFEIRSAMAARTAHHINNPVNAIIGFGAIVADLNRSIRTRFEQLLPPAHHRDDSATTVANSFTSDFEEIEDTLSSMNMSLKRVSHVVKELQLISGIHGFNVEIVHVGSLLKKIKEECAADEALYKRDLKWIIPSFIMDLEAFGNESILARALFYVLKEIIDELPPGKSLSIAVEANQTIKSFLSLSMLFVNSLDIPSIAEKKLREFSLSSHVATSFAAQLSVIQMGGFYQGINISLDTTGQGSRLTERSVG